MLARLIIRASFMRKTFVLLVCIRMYPYVSRMYPYVTRMLVVCQSYVFVCIRMLLVCYSYVTRMYSCGVLVMILATRVREHLSSDKNSHIFQHINGSEACRSLCSEDCFSILDTASTPFQLKIKEALHIAWEKPSLNKQVNHVNLTLSL